MKEDDDRRLRHAATIDSLTGILNRGAFFAAARTAMETGARAGRPLALLMVDVDHFKRINDTYGHPAGDRVLQALVRVIAGGIRPADVFGRLGGEEFAVLLPDAARGDAVVVAERIRLSVRGLVVSDLPQISCSISIGCAVLRPQGGEDLDLLMSRGDEALYDAKHNGRDCVIVAGDAAAAAPSDAVKV
nr:GGDEF domain-containing protein [Xanthobacter agilis]